MDHSRKKLRLGDVLVNSKAITNTQLLQALDLQKGSGKKLGEVLVEEGIREISNVVQTNSSAARESATLSKELSGQARTLNSLLGRFHIVEPEHGQS